ncbi:MAG: hypothetical protein ACRDYC_13900 [Acidimicrobiales bacterium]
MATRILRPDGIARWSDARLAEAIREMWGIMRHHGVGHWEELPETYRTNAWLLRLEWSRRHDQMSLF